MFSGLISQTPNLLTFLRIVACPALVILLQQEDYAFALFVFLLAGITDGLDGYIAKRYDCVSELGAILDPIADKLLIACAYIMLAILQAIPFYLLIVVMFRDLVIVAGYLILVMMGEQVPMKPAYISKINTFLQIALVLAVLLDKVGGPVLLLSWLVQGLILGVIVTTVASGVRYIWAWGIRHEYKSAD